MVATTRRRRTMLVPVNDETKCSDDECPKTNKITMDKSVLFSEQVSNEKRWVCQGPTERLGFSDWVLAWAATSAAGLMDGQNKMNQDIIAGEWLESRAWFAVCDGHGSAGTNASRVAAEAFANKIKENISILTNDESCQHALHEAIAAAEEACIQKLNSAASNSGTTLVAWLLTDTYNLHIASVGDSVCHFVCFDKFGKRMTEFRTSPHRCEIPSEKTRLEAAGAIIQDGRVWRINVDGRRELGLAMSRSLGDTSAKAIGVSAEPDILSLPIPSNCHSFILLLCSDGISDVLDLDHLINSIFYPILCENTFRERPADAAARLNTALADLDQQAESEWWKNADDDGYVDDRSLVVLLSSSSSLSLSLPSG